MPLMQMRKVDHFIRVHPHRLECNEWRVKWAMVIDGRSTTYNPDYFNPETGRYVEVATSVENVSAQRQKWRQAIADGHPLDVYWWDGTAITGVIINSDSLPSGLRHDRNADLPASPHEQP